MEMLTAFQLGSYPNLVGVHFNVMEVLRRVAEVESVHARVQTQGERLAARRKETVGLVLFTEELCDRAGLQRAARPQTYAEYQAWAGSVSKQALAAVQPSAYETAAFFLGHNLGDLELTLSIRVVVDDMLAGAPDHPFLTQQAAALGASEARARRNLELLALSPALPDATLGVLRDVTGIIAGLASPPVDRTEMFRKLEARRQDIAHSLVPPEPKR